MVYKNNLVATVKVGGKILRENQSTVTVPFGADYSIYIKNLSSVRALVRVTLDGQPISDIADGWIIADANRPLELERFIRNGNFNKGNKFKFIERTGAVEEHRGIGAEDGLLRVEYKFEAPQLQNMWPNQTITVSTPSTWTTSGSPPYTGYSLSDAGINSNTQSDGGTNTVFTTSCSTSRSSVSSRPSFNAQNILRSVTESKAVDTSAHCMMFAETSLQNEAGITVAGGESNQQFSWGSWFPTEEASHVIVLKLVGTNKGGKVTAPITVQHKPKCVTCGKLNKAINKFCFQCGTALELF